MRHGHESELVIFFLIFGLGVVLSVVEVSLALRRGRSSFYFVWRGFDRRTQPIGFWLHVGLIAVVGALVALFLSWTLWLVFSAPPG